jgi:hypothetical protein
MSETYAARIMELKYAGPRDPLSDYDDGRAAGYAHGRYDASLVAAEADAKLAEREAENAKLRERHAANIAARDAARRDADKATEQAADAERRLKELQHSVRVPEGAKRLDAWEHNGQLIVCGDPVDTGDDDPNGHNCDMMGCTSVSHVIIREKLNADGTLARAAKLAEAEKRIGELEGR